MRPFLLTCTLKRKCGQVVGSLKTWAIRTWHDLGYVIFCHRPFPDGRVTFLTEPANRHSAFDNGKCRGELAASLGATWQGSSYRALAWPSFQFPTRYLLSLHKMCGPLVKAHPLKRWRSIKDLATRLKKVACFIQVMEISVWIVLRVGSTESCFHGMSMNVIPKNASEV